MSDPLQVLIVDDEELARLRLRGLVQDCPSPKAQVAGEAANASQALVWLAEHRCDLVLLDIHMPGLDGTQLAARVKQLPQAPAIVFVTAHAEHALQAFDLEAVDYLTKPVRRERLHAALQRVVQRAGAARPAADAGEEPVIVVSELGRKVRVPVSEVLYLKAELKYVTLRTATHTHVLDDALTDLEQRLGDRFLRIHRNALVARKALRALERRVLPAEGEEEAAEGWVVRVAPVDEWLVVSRRQVAAVKEAIAEGGL
ncbi:LytTR family DNA-binding domain-containing protein [Piscinibacter sp. HJYY11]|uniref:LytR/AlgR family response regulator transcription factor n=1 Tax=Piscinibacter sp. HJYY11 TaxID=2801333 RepID=UPI00191DF4E1|nr:LytTR family DNA-binding domain-containing protein [Piscinibacter sp. HJYY11]MBL0727704.1 response regulator transcription factor [Piscinibacter sp. HJYY11]